MVRDTRDPGDGWLGTQEIQVGDRWLGTREIQVGDGWLGTPEVQVGDGHGLGDVDTDDVHQVSPIRVGKRAV